MNKTLKWFLLTLGGILLIALLGLTLLKSSTKKHSPEQEQWFVEGDLSIDLFYCSPSKKGREIFGGLVPYNQVWRTGANEPSTITTNKTIAIGGQELSPGTYSIFSIPGKEEWTLIFNKGTYDWGVNWDETSTRDPSKGEILVKAIPTVLDEAQESLTISISKGNPNRLSLVWDKTSVSAPITY